MQVRLRATNFKCHPTTDSPRGQKPDPGWAKCGQCDFGYVHPQKRKTCKRCKAKVVKEK